LSAAIFWLTGLSGAGKTTLCEMVKPLLEAQGKKVKILDGDDVRATYNDPIGFEYPDILRNNLHIVELAKLHRSEFDVILIPVIAPYEEIRTAVKSQLAPSYFLVYCNANVEVVSNRDTKGLYSKAQSGAIKNLVGVSTGFPYQVPILPDLVLDTKHDSSEGQQSCAQMLLAFIQRHSAT
jgi:adenylylsulfate kinase